MTDAPATPSASDLEPSPAELGDTITVEPEEWTAIDDSGTEIYLYGDRPATIVVRLPA